jgi:probable F420-dependent oxidoreductase
MGLQLARTKGSGEMKLDAEIYALALADVGALSSLAERAGFDCLWFNETKHDPFVQLALCASSTTRILVGTSIALAFTRSPTSLAYAGWDIQNLSKGRLMLGLGTQVKGHIERRFGMRWDSPAPKMKETVLALRAVWRSWQEGTPLDFRGRFFNIDLMTPFFSPGPLEHPRIPILVAGVNRGMCRVAGQVADGLHVHPFHTLGYLRDVVLPSVASGRPKEAFSVAASVFAALGNSSREVAEERERCRSQIAFYASTRTYRSVLELHGWGDICDRLHAHSVAGRWKEMAAEIPDDVLDEFVVQGTWAEVGGRLRARYAGLADRVRIYRAYDGKEAWKELLRGFRA